MNVIKTNIEFKVINTLDELPEPDEMLVVHQTVSLYDWAQIMEVVFGEDLITASED